MASSGQSPSSPHKPMLQRMRQRVKAICSSVKIINETLWSQWLIQAAREKDLIYSWDFFPFELEIHCYRREGLTVLIKERRWRKTSKGSQEWLCHLSPDLHVDKDTLPLSSLSQHVMHHTCTPGSFPTPAPLTSSLSRFQTPLEVGEGSCRWERGLTQVTAGRY